MSVSTRAMVSTWVASLLGLLVATPVLAADEAKAEPKAALARLKSLAGEWTSEASPGHPSQKVVYRVISNGNVVMETLFPGTEHEMVTMYLVDGDELRLTHYCASGNQPRLKLDPKISAPDKLEFVFDGGSNLNPAKDMHMHAGRIVFKDKNHIESEWDGYVEGKKVGANRLVLSRP